MSIPRALVRSSQWLGKAAACSVALSLCLAASTAHATASVEMDFPAFHLKTTDDVLKSKGCDVTDLNTLRNNEFEQANARSQQYAKVLGNSLFQNPNAGNCRTNFSGLLDKAHGAIATDLFSFFKNAVASQLVAGLVSSAVDQGALGAMGGACDDVFKTNSNYVNNMKNNGLFTRSVSTTGDVNYPVAALAVATPSNGNASTSIDNTSGNTTLAGSFGDYDNAVNDAIDQVANDAYTTNGHGLANGSYSMCGITFALSGYSTEDGTNTTTANLSRVTTSGANAGCTLSDNNGDGIYDYRCNTVNGSQKLFETRSRTTPTTTTLTCPTAPYDLRSKENYQNSINNTSGGAFRLKNGTKTATDVTSPQTAAPAAPANKDDKSKSFFGLKY